jgi:Rab9 effector protein with kelch motifs
VSSATWALELATVPTWVQLAPQGSPPSARQGHTAIYDAAGDRMIVFGGRDATGNLNDLWVLDFAPTLSWSPLVPLGEPPPARDQHTAVDDGANQRMLVLGGSSAGDVWELSLGGAPA